jgi:hypothetical protein
MTATGVGTGVGDSDGVGACEVAGAGAPGAEVELGDAVIGAACAKTPRE